MAGETVTVGANEVASLGDTLLNHGIPGLAALLFLVLCYTLPRYFKDLPPAMRLIAITMTLGIAALFLGGAIYAPLVQPKIAVKIDLGEREPKLMELVVFRSSGGRHLYTADMDLNLVNRERLSISLDKIIDRLLETQAQLSAREAEIRDKGRMIAGQQQERADAVRSQVEEVISANPGLRAEGGA
ncbi:hypothetical protein [Frigidibacter sp. MR17.24]|uniref:hypothetical protein n=1 Tax=Frigidibacter sp. MR17.24 TaxID=3127345 RepID=UPI003012B1FA